MARIKVLPLEKFPGVPRGRQNGAGLTPDGAEKFDPDPLVLRVKGREINDMDRIRMAIQNLRFDQQGDVHETFEEADDFEVDDDAGDFSSQHEISADQEELYKIVEPVIQQARRPRRMRQLHLQDENLPKSTTGNPVVPPPAGNPTEGKP